MACTELTDLVKKAEKYVTDKADIVIATLHAAGHNSSLIRFQADVIYVLNSDLVPEPAMWPIFATQNKLKQLVLFGDCSPGLPHNAGIVRPGVVRLC